MENPGVQQFEVLGRALTAALRVSDAWTCLVSEGPRAHPTTRTDVEVVRRDNVEYAAAMEFEREFNVRRTTTIVVGVFPQASA